VKKKAKKKVKRKLIFDQKGLEAFAKHLKKVRKKKDLTQSQLAFESGLTLSQIARIETVRTNPTLSTVFAIARALEMEEELFELFRFKLPPNS
jgi:transcriptional regulator with XRE-family HTH domain